jgi:hypothetical protein
MKVVLLLGSMVWAATTWAYTVSANVYKTNGSQADVQAACTAAPGGGTATVTIPNGTYNWSGTLTIDKAVTIAGETGTGVTINNNNGSGDMIKATSGTDGHVNIHWLNIVQVANNQGGVGFAISADRNDSSPYTVMIHDCKFNGSKVFSYAVQALANGIVFWNDVFIGDGTNGIGGISFVCDKYGYAGWNTPDA